MRIMLKSKIHRAHITDCNIDYQGSITIDSKLMEESDLLPFEQVHVFDINNGSRFITYAIEGGPGEICINGAAARLVSRGDLAIILSFCHLNDEVAHGFRPTLVHVDVNNRSASAQRNTEIDLHPEN